jgi:hypothetical protein
MSLKRDSGWANVMGSNFISLLDGMVFSYDNIIHSIHDNAKNRLSGIVVRNFQK